MRHDWPVVEKKADVAARSLARVTLFVTRARRVEEHSLAADKPKLLGWARGEMTVTVADGRAMLSRQFPPEELLDSLAARCRPFILNNDPVYHQRVGRALSYLLRGDTDRSRQLTDLRADWDRLDPSDTSALGYLARVGPVGGSLEPAVTDKALALAWLYGDLVHADDDITERVGQHDINARFEAGVGLVAKIAVLTISTLNFIRDARTAGLVQLSDDVFSAPVLARTAYALPVTAIVTAPVGTDIQTMEAAIDDL